jgi:proteasome activator subunit 4
MSFNHPLLELVFKSDTLPAPDLSSMEGDDISVPGSPDIVSGGATTPSAVDIQLASLKTYVDSLPYKCESLEEMQTKLEAIVAKLVVCVKSRNWAMLNKWDSSLQWYVATQPTLQLITSRL